MPGHTERTHEYGGENLFSNWVLGRLAKQRANIASHEADYQRYLTAIDGQYLEREYQVFLNENRIQVARLALAEGMDIVTYGLVVLERVRARLTAELTLFTASVTDFYAAKAEKRRLKSKREEVEIEGDQKTLLNKAEVAKARDDIATENIDDQRTIDLGLDINRKLYARREAIGQKIADTQAKIRAMKRRTDIDGDERNDRLFQYAQDLADLTDERDSLREKKKDAKGRAEE